MAAVMAVMQGVMTFAQGNQQASQMKAQAQQAEYQAAAERANAQIAERNREVAGANAAEELRGARNRKELVAGQNTAALGGAGLESGSGLGLALDRANVMSFEQQTEKIRQNLFTSDLDLRQEVANRNQAAAAADATAKNLRSAAKNTRRMAILGGVLTTASGLMGGGKASKASKGASSGGAQSYGLGSNGYGWGNSNHIGFQTVGKNYKTVLGNTF